MKDKGLKKIEKLINRLNFGLFFPIWYLNCKVKYYLSKLVSQVEIKFCSKDKYERIIRDRNHSQGFILDLQLFCNYNLIDTFVGFSIMFMPVIIADTFIVQYFADISEMKYVFIASCISAIFFVYYFFHRHDKREKYFVEFDKEPVKEKWKWSAISVALLFGSWALVIFLHHYYAD